MFSTMTCANFAFETTFNSSSANALKSDQSKILSSGNGGKGLTLTNEKTFDQSKLKAFADDKIDVTHISKFALRMVENIVEKGENAGYQHFLLFPQCFQKLSFLGSQKVGIVR